MRASIGRSDSWGDGSEKDSKSNINRKHPVLKRFWYEKDTIILRADEMILTTATKTEYQNMYVTKDILKKIRKIYPTQQIVLYWDNARWHKGSVVQEWIKQDGHLKVIHFPTYALELNPQEHVWKSGRGAVTHNQYIENIDEAIDDLLKYFKRMVFSYSLIGFCSGL